MPIDPNRAWTAFLVAVKELDPASRAAYLDREFGSDIALRERIEELLRLSLLDDALLATQASDANAIQSGAGQSSRSKDDSQSGDTFTYGAGVAQNSASDQQRAYEATGTFAKGTVHGQAAGTSVGMMIGNRYTLLEQIGEGGMGSVYLASQSEPVRREVAIKLIKAGMDSKSVLARFEAERQALAVMDHPNIARIYDGGVTPAGQPYFVMELVRGTSITTYCDQHRLDVTARLQLFVAVCQAVQHAHLKGIIHRDLKPGNVLIAEVDGRPTPKVINFGVAKAIDQKLTDISFSDIGAVVGTPMYMSPEQAEPSLMDIDTRTDIYALGVMLYELLTGSTPFDKNLFKRAAILEMLRMVREFNPPKPSTKLSDSNALPSIAADRNIDPSKLSKLVRGELDCVVMKALEKDRTRRYETANGFAEDIRRYLANEVVEARPPSQGYRLKKFVSRHKKSVAVVVTFMLTLCIALAVVAYLAVKADVARNQAIEARELESQAKKRADTARELESQAKKRAEQYFETSRTLVLEMSGRIEALETGLANKNQSDLARKSALDSARELFDKFRAEQPNDRHLQRQSAALHRYAANVSRLLNDTAAAEKAFITSIGIWEQLVAGDANSAEDRDNLSQVIADYGTFQKRAGRLKDAASTLQKAEKLALATKNQIPDSSFRRTLGKVEMDRADVEFRRGDYVAAEVFSRQATKNLETLKDFPIAERNPIDPLLVVIAQLARAMALRELDRDQEAIEENNGAVARMEALMIVNPSRDIRYFANRAKFDRAKTWAKSAGRLKDVGAELTAVLESADKLITENTSIPAYRELQVEVWLFRAELATKAKNPKGANEYLAKALVATRSLLDSHGNQPDHIGLRAKTFLLLGRLAVAEKNWPDAKKNLETAKTVYEFAIKFDPEQMLYRRGLEEAIKELAAAKVKP